MGTCRSAAWWATNDAGADGAPEKMGKLNLAHSATSRMPPSMTKAATLRILSRATRISPAIPALVSPRQSMQITEPAGASSMARRCGLSGLLTRSTMVMSSRMGMKRTVKAGPTNRRALGVTAVNPLR